jgi:hypothetical protein
MVQSGLLHIAVSSNLAWNLLWIPAILRKEFCAKNTMKSTQLLDGVFVAHGFMAASCILLVLELCFFADADLP